MKRTSRWSLPLALRIGRGLSLSSLTLLAVTAASVSCSSSGADANPPPGGGAGDSQSDGVGGSSVNTGGTTPSGSGGSVAPGRGGATGTAGSDVGGNGGSASGGGGSSGSAQPGTADAGQGQGGGGGSAGLADAAPGVPGSGGAPPSGDPPVGPEPDLATRMRCSGTNPIACHLGGQPGNYDVTVVLGGTAAGTTLVNAEAHRAMLGAVTTTAGQSQRFSFTVNVRQPEGEPVQAAAPAGTPGLDLEFARSGTALPQLLSLGYAAATKPFMIYVAGDSTVCDQASLAFGGWAQQLPKYFNDPVSIANYADSGESSGSFLANNALFGAIESRLKADDWVLIQFGHNDKTVTATTFHDNMTRLVTRVKAKGALPVLITPVARAQFNGNTVSPQHINSTGANLPVIVKQVGTEQMVPVLDLTARTVVWLTELGPTGWQAFHANGTDVTHTNPAGANVEAGFVRDLIKQANLTPLVEKLR